ncbi:MAG: protein serine phosphatase with GAF(s) sensor(s) [Puniceicoccaceae bacterium 5H]|nr:MAG: protein serine phosphatase with GAF(s) sensor(s) [Puniceicoccaceae bacterium 5H]
MLNWWYFLLGLATGGSVGAYFWWRARREITRLDEDKQFLNQEKLIVLDFMHNMVEPIGHGVTRQELLKRMMHASILSTGALCAAVYERRDDELQGVAVEGLFPPQRPGADLTREKSGSRTKQIEKVMRSEVFRVGEGLIGQVARTGSGLFITDARQDPRVVQYEDPSLQIYSIIVVPVCFRDTTLAILALANPADGSTFTETDFSLARSLADQAALAVHNLDLMELQIEKNRLDMDLGLAKEIQDKLLPRRYPETALLDIAAIYRPAQTVGGDLYDVFQLDDHRYGIAIADVSGKGIPASLVMAVCQSNLRHLARQYSSPAKVLTELNAVMNEEMRADMFVTIIYAVIDTQEDSLTLCRAGHELPILMHCNTDSGEITSELLESEGMAIGMVPNEFFAAAVDDKKVAFARGDIFLLYTDGVTEMANDAGAEYSNERLTDTIRRLSGQKAVELNDGILQSMASFAGPDRQQDDVTIITVKHC